MTRNSERLVIGLVGLPARGKSFISRKLKTFLLWSGHKCKIFNVGKYRREAIAIIAKEKEEATGVPASHAPPSAGTCDASFFDSKNQEAAILRQRVAELALRDMLRWLDGEDDESMNNDAASSQSQRTEYSAPARGNSQGNNLEGNRIAIFDATNSTNTRRSWILEECTSPTKRAGKPTGVVFVESICDDEELLRQNYRFKVSSSPDFQGMDEEEALADLRMRVGKYEEQYETITDDSQSYIKIFNLSTKLLVNHIYGRMAKVIVPAIMAWNVGTRPIFLCRPGKTPHSVRMDGEDNVCRSDDSSNLDASTSGLNRKFKGEKLGRHGIEFRTALEAFMASESMAFALAQKAIASHPSLYTGTSVTGLSSFEHEVGLDGHELAFPLTIFTSTMPRAADTATWEQFQFPVGMKSSLNPLDKGDFAGMELEQIAVLDPVWYAKLEADPYTTRFPGGESYKDLISRLESVIIDMEQQTAPVMVVSHVSVLQSLISYFNNSPAHECMGIEVPMHTVIKFTPSRGGGWVESRHPLLPPEDLSDSSGKLNYVESTSELSALDCSDHMVPSTPIWGDHLPPKNRSFST